MTFTIRELIWATFLILLLVVRFIDQADNRERQLQTRLLAHRVDQDVHDHLKEVTTRIVVLEGWATSIDRWKEDDSRDDAALEQTLAGLITDVGALEGKWPKRGTK